MPTHSASAHRSPGKAARLFRSATSILIALYLGIFAFVLVRGRISLPVSDMLAWISAYLKLQPGLFAFAAYLWAWHNEHHLVWIRILTAIDVRFLGTRGLAFVAAATVAQLATAGLIAHETRHGCTPRSPAAPLARLVPLLALTAPAAADCAIPINAVYPLALFFSMAALVLFDGQQDRARTGLRRTAALGAAIAAGLANGVGLAVWPALLWCAWRGGAGRRWCLAISVTALSFAAVYLLGRPPGLMPAASGDLFASIGRDAAYGAAFLGLPFSASPPALWFAKWLGAAVMAAIIYLIAHATITREYLSRPNRIAVACLVLTATITVLAATGRAGLAPNAIVPIRYMVLLTPLYVGLAWLVLGHIHRPPSWHATMPACAVALAALLLLQQAVLGRELILIQDRWNKLSRDYYAGLRSPAMNPLIYPDLNAADSIRQTMRQAGISVKSTP